MGCEKCNDTGVNDTGNNELPCDCPAGDRALFNTAGVEGPVTGGEMKRHFLNNSPHPIKLGPGTILAASLPGRAADGPAVGELPAEDPPIVLR